MGAPSGHAGRVDRLDPIVMQPLEHMCSHTRRLVGIPAFQLGWMMIEHCPEPAKGFAPIDGIPQRILKATILYSLDEVTHELVAFV